MPAITHQTITQAFAKFNPDFFNCAFAIDILNVSLPTSPFVFQFKEVKKMMKDREPDLPVDNPLRSVRSNIVQSIRAFTVPQLQEAAKQLNHNFFYANLANVQGKQDLLDTVSAQFNLPTHFGKNFDALYDCITDPLHKSGPQAGFIVVLEHIPANSKFDKESREQLLDIFRDASDYWNDRKVPFRCFYSFQ